MLDDDSKIMVVYMAIQKEKKMLLHSERQTQIKVKA